MLFGANRRRTSVIAVGGAQEAVDVGELGSADCSGSVLSAQGAPIHQVCRQCCVHSSFSWLVALRKRRNHKPEKKSVAE